ncbi:MAG: family 2 glycosyl transferase [Chitinophagaceae bacterium]|nr:family 2 glycosyl transferase [Chitinophagaceae bacterium]
MTEKIFATVSLIYALWILFLWRAWRKIVITPAAARADKPGISIVIAFRNEATNLNQLLRSLAQQDYPSSSLELLLINDHSEDAYEEIIKPYISFPYALRVLHLPHDQQGKKQAIRYGVQQASHDWILTTDADCEVGSQWASVMLRHAQATGARFVFGPVAYRIQPTFLSHFQNIELFSLIGSGAALWQSGYPTMCNGANLLYHRSLMNGDDPYAQNAHLASGDDEFLMHQVYRRQSSDVSFVKNKESLVLTAPCFSWRALYQQRKRWASKWGAYEMPHVKRIALAVFMANCFYAILPIVACLDPILIPWIIGIYVFRWVMDGIFIHKITRFYNKPFNLVRYAEVAILYPWYVVISAIAGRAGKYTWKGRNVS